MQSKTCEGRQAILGHNWPRCGRLFWLAQPQRCSNRHRTQRCNLTYRCNIELEVELYLEALKPTIVLVEPQIGENIGSAARAMKNFGLSDLRLVKPRDGWPNPAAYITASHASDLLDSARLYDSVEDAIADLERVYAATARTRFMSKPFVTSRQLPGDLRQLAAAAAKAATAAAEAEAAAAAAAAEAATAADATTFAAPAAATEGTGVITPSFDAATTTGSAPASTSDNEPSAATNPRPPRAGVLFGRESSGLTNEEVAAANKVLTIEANPTYPILNMAQAIVCTAYELYQARLDLAGASVAARAAIPPAGAPTADGSAAATQMAYTVTTTADADADDADAVLAVMSPAGGSVASTAAADHAAVSSGISGSKTALQPPPSASPQPPTPQQTITTTRVPIAAPPAPLAGSRVAVSSSASELRQRASTVTLATRGELDNFLQRLVSELDGASFFASDDRRPATMLSIRNLAGKVEGLTRAEVALLHGMLSKLVGRGRGQGQGVKGQGQQGEVGVKPTQ